MKPVVAGNCYECNGKSVMVDRVENGEVYYAKYRCHIGEFGGPENLDGFFHAPLEWFEQQISQPDVKADD